MLAPNRSVGVTVWHESEESIIVMQHASEEIHSGLETKSRKEEIYAFMDY